MGMEVPRMAWISLHLFSFPVTKVIIAAMGLALLIP